MDIFPIDNSNPQLTTQKTNRAEQIISGLVTATDTYEGNASVASGKPVSLTAYLYGDEFRSVWRYLIDRWVVVNAVQGITGQSIRRINAVVDDKDVTFSFDNTTNSVTCEKLKS